MKLLKYLAILFLLIIILTATVGILLNQRSDDIQKILKTELNNSFNGNISFKSLSISNIKSFPYVAIIINHFYVVEPIKYSADTICQFDEVYLEFGLHDFLKKKYVIKSLLINKGYIQINTYFDGTNSLKYLKTTKKGKNFDLRLNKINISNIEFSFHNSLKKSSILFFIKKGKTSGLLNANNIYAEVKSELKTHYFAFDNVAYFNNKNILIDVNLSYNGNEININKSSIDFNGIDLNSYGKIITADKSHKYNLAIKGSNINLNSFIKQLPETLSKNFKYYEANGNLSINCYIKGNSNQYENPDIKTFININNGMLKHAESNFRLYNLNIEGLFSNGAFHKSTSSYLSINKISGNLNDISFNGNAKINNFIAPEVNIKTNAKIPITTLAELINNDTIKGTKGLIEANLNTSFYIENIKKFKIINNEKLQINGNILIHNSKIDILKNSINNLNGEIIFGKNIYFKAISGKLNNNFLLINGILENSLTDFFLKKRDYKFKGNLYSNKLNLNNTKYSGLFIPFDTVKNETNFPLNIQFISAINIDTLIYNKFRAFNVNGNATYIPKYIKIPDLTFNTEKGKYKGNIVIAQNSFNNYFLKSRTQVNNIDIKNMFKSFNNFGQNTLTNKEISGTLSGNIIISTEFSNKLEILKDKINCYADIEIKNGKLINFKPAYKLSDYIDIEELKEIEFSNLKNIVYIKNQEISFPEMEIYSSAYNIKLAGVHHFNNTFNYNVELLLSEFLSKKARNKNYANNRGVFSEKGRMKIHLLLYGSIDDPQYKFNLKKATESLKSSLANEKQEVKSIIDEEFKKSDQDAKTKDTKKKNDSFEIEWTEDENSKENSKIKQENDQKPEFNIIWEEFDDTL